MSRVIDDMFNMEYPVEEENLLVTLEEELDRVYHDSITRLLQIQSLSKENHLLKAQIVELERQFYRRQIVDSNGVEDSME